jgi:hypothetical protein
MHRTTINLENSTYNKVIALAEQRGKSLAKTIQIILNTALIKKNKKKLLNLPLHKNNGPRHGIDITDRGLLYDIMEDIK